MIETKLVNLTPDFAKQLLGTNENNRKVKIRSVKGMVSDIKSGLWQVNGDTIKVDCNGKLIDGQHRCLAVVEAGLPVSTFVTTGLSPDVYKTIDLRCQKRSMSDVLHMQGVLNTTNTVAICNYLYPIHLGYFSLKILPWSYPTINMDCVNRLIDEYPEIKEYITLAHGLKSICVGTGISKCQMAAFAVITGRISKDMSIEFLSGVASGVNMTQTDTRMLLRNKMIQASITRKQLHYCQSWAYIIKAWNLFYTKTQTSKLVFDIDKEKIPLIKGIEKANINWNLFDDILSLQKQVTK